jgi:hypothetical protein
MSRRSAVERMKRQVKALDVLKTNMLKGIDEAIEIVECTPFEELTRGEITDNLSILAEYLLMKRLIETHRIKLQETS